VGRFVPAYEDTCGGGSCGGGLEHSDNDSDDACEYRHGTLGAIMIAARRIRKASGVPKGAQARAQITRGKLNAVLKRRLNEAESKPREFRLDFCVFLSMIFNSTDGRGGISLLFPRGRSWQGIAREFGGIVEASPPTLNW